MPSISFLDELLKLSPASEIAEGYPIQLDGQPICEFVLPAAICKQLTGKFSQPIENRLQRLAKEQLSGPLDDDSLLHSTTLLRARLQQMEWPENVLACLISAAEQIRACLLGLVQELRDAPFQLSSLGSQTTGSLDSETHEVESTSSLSGPARPKPKNLPLARWEVFHQAVDDLPETMLQTWLLAHYLGFSTKEYLRLTGNVEVFSASNRAATELIGQKIQQLEIAITDKPSDQITGSSKQVLPTSKTIKPQETQGRITDKPGDQITDS